MISVRRVSLGGGYRYLISSVAGGDGAAEHSNSLSGYYSSSGMPPGVCLGTGLARLDRARGVHPGSEVTGAHLENMLAACADPVSGESVGGTPKAPRAGVPVAGFDHIQPSESASVAQALTQQAPNQSSTTATAGPWKWWSVKPKPKSSARVRGPTAWSKSTSTAWSPPASLRAKEMAGGALRY